MKAKFLALAALILGMVSCQTDVVEGLHVDANGEAELTLQVGLPEATRAAGNDSALGAIGNVDMDKYDIRFILKVYDAKGELAKECQPQVGDATEAKFSLRLVPGRDYRFVVWADFVNQGSKVDLHYNTSKFPVISLNNGVAQGLNDESRDAYTAVYEVESYSSSSKIEPIILTRPFAKLRVITTDMNQLYSKLTSATVKYTSKLYTSFNALNQAVDTESSKSFEKTVVYGDDTKYNGEPKNGEMTLFADYFFGSEDDRVMFTLDVDDETDYRIPTVNFNTNIPVQRNHLTTVKGNILTDANEITVTIEEDFEKDNIEWPSSDVQKLEYAAMFGGEVTLTNHVALSKPLCVAANKHLIINLNGYQIYNNTNSLEYGKGEAIIAYGKLTIKGNGVVSGSTRAVWARGNDGAEVNIYGGDYRGCKNGFTGGGNSVIYASSGNVVNIYGGEFRAEAIDKTSYGRADAQGGLYAALNVADNNGMINVYGGKFFKQNPAAPLTEPTSWDPTHPNGFVAEGYCSYPVSDDYYQVYSLEAARNKTFSTKDCDKNTAFELLRTVFRNGGKVEIKDHNMDADVYVTEALIADGVNVEITGDGEIYLKSGVTSIYEPGVASALICAKDGATITFNDYSGYVNGGSEDYAIETRGGNIVINGNNGHFHGAVSAAYALEGTITINGGTFVDNSSYNAQYLLNCHDANYKNGTANIVVKGGTFNGFNPADNAAEGPQTNFVADGYKSTKSGNTWKVSKQ